MAFPERDPKGQVWADLEKKQDWGICFSGGGTRAAACAVGQLRALQQLNLLQETRYISAVSGGSWTATPFTFLPDGVEKFLGEYVPPGQLTCSNLAACEGSMLHAISKAFVTGRGLGGLAAGRGSESYARVISKLFLAPFGLGDNKRWFTWNATTANEVIKENPLLKERAYTVAPGRPFLIVGGTIRHYDSSPMRWKNDPIKRVPVEFTPLYSGVRPSIVPAKYNRKPIGGGYVESFAYDSKNAKKSADKTQEAEVTLYKRLPWRTEPLLNLGDIMGSSGAAPGEFSLLVELFGFPKFDHWSPAALDNDGVASSARYAHQDGGLSENLGLIPLLGRQVKRIIAFVNAEDEVIVGNGPARFPDYINGLFGRTPCGWFEATQVFPSNGLDDIANQLAARVREGRAAIARTSLSTLANTRFGVGQYEVEVCWVFLDARLGGENRKASQSWISQLPPLTGSDSDVRKLVQSDRFPRYRTFFEDRPVPLWDVIRLTPEKATSLAHYTSWVLVSEAQDITSFLCK